jgi:hypothetical protein
LFLLPIQNGKRGTRSSLIRLARSFSFKYFQKRNTFVPSPDSKRKKRNTPAPNSAGAFLFLQIFSKEEHICSFSRFRTAKEEHARPLIRPARSFSFKYFQKRNTFVPSPVSEQQKRNTPVPNPAGAFLFLQIFSKEEHICSLSRFKRQKRNTLVP